MNLEDMQTGELTDLGLCRTCLFGDASDATFTNVYVVQTDLDDFNTEDFHESFKRIEKQIMNKRKAE